MAQTVQNLPAMWDTWVQSLWEDPLKKGTPSHSSFLTCRIPWIEEPGRLQSMVFQRVRHFNLHTLSHSSHIKILIVIMIEKDKSVFSKKVSKNANLSTGIVTWGSPLEIVFTALRCGRGEVYALVESR